MPRRGRRISIHPLHSSEWNVGFHRPRRCDITNRMAMRHPLCQREWRLIYVLFRASLRFAGVWLQPCQKSISDYLRPDPHPLIICFWIIKFDRDICHRFTPALQFYARTSINSILAFVPFLPQPIPFAISGLRFVPIISRNQFLSAVPRAYSCAFFRLAFHSAFIFVMWVKCSKACRIIG